MHISRDILNIIKKRYTSFPCVAILGSRQVGKSTLAKEILKKTPKSIYIDLEKFSDFQKLQNLEVFLDSQKGNLVCIDEIQRLPNLFPELRSWIDETNRKEKFLLLGSASGNLLKQSGESLAGRVAYIELTPLQYLELPKKITLRDHWVRGGFPRSLLSKKDEDSFIWREEFLKTLFTRDLQDLGMKLSSVTMERLWKMCSHLQGQTVNYSKIGENLGFSHTSIRSYVDLFTQSFLMRTLEPYSGNLKKRLIKSPKLYIRDSGLLHSILQINNFDSLLGNPIYGASFEGYIIEQILSSSHGYLPSFLRTASGDEIDLVLEKGNQSY